MMRRASVMAATPKNCCRTRGAGVARFFGVKLHAREIFLLDDGGEWEAVVARSDGLGAAWRARRRSARSRSRRRRECREGGALRARGATDSSRCAGDFTFCGRARTSSGKKPRPDSPGASSLAAYMACRPRQIPRIGVPESNAARRERVRLRSRRPATKAEKCPTPGRTMASRGGELLGTDGALGFGAEACAARARRRGDCRRRSQRWRSSRESFLHSSPLVDGRTRRRRLSRATAKRSALANALKMAST